MTAALLLLVAPNSSVVSSGSDQSRRHPIIPTDGRRAAEWPSPSGRGGGGLCLCLSATLAPRLRALRPPAARRDMRALRAAPKASRLVAPSSVGALSARFYGLTAVSVRLLTTPPHVSKLPASRASGRPTALRVRQPAAEHVVEARGSDCRQSCVGGCEHGLPAGQLCGVGQATSRCS